MKTENLKRCINNIIKNTFELVQEAYKHNEAKIEILVENGNTLSFCLFTKNIY